MPVTPHTTRAARSVRLISAASLAAASAVLMALLPTSAARADGGSYPSNAPVITPGTTVNGGADETESVGHGDAGLPGVQYWKVSLQRGDQLRGDFTNITGEGTALCVLSATVTDYTVGNSDCLAEEHTGSTNKAELIYTAAGSGNYILSIFDDSWFSGESWAYDLTVKVRHRTTTSLAGPKTGRQGKSVTLHGAVTPALTGEVTLQSKSLAHGWITAGKVQTNAKGVFTFKYRLGHSGPHQFKVTYGGSSRYLRSTSSIWKLQSLPR